MLHYSVAYDTIRMRCGQSPNTRKYKRYPAILASPMKSTTNSFAKTRRDHAAETAEDYVEAIDDIQNSKGECRVREALSKGLPEPGLSHLRLRAVEAFITVVQAHHQKSGVVFVSEDGKRALRGRRVGVLFVARLPLCLNEGGG